jgi:hypothetical protein
MMNIIYELHDASSSYLEPGYYDVEVVRTQLVLPVNNPTPTLKFHLRLIGRSED